MPQSNQRWYPTKQQLSNPVELERTLRQVLKQHYDLQDAHRTLLAQVNAPAHAKPKGPPPGSGPVDTQICGLFVAPIDPATLTNGALLRYDKANGNFKFS
jgi:hypothetical protein